MTIENQTPTTEQPRPPRFSSAYRPACAACRHQRYRCAPSCAMAPYFPADKKNEFQNVQRLFGIKNVFKLLKTVPENLRDEAMASVIYEANIRAARPVGGCYAIISNLKGHIAMCQAELEMVKKSIAFQQARLQQNITNYDIGGSSVDDQMPFFENQEFNNNGVGHHFLNDKPG